MTLKAKLQHPKRTDNVGMLEYSYKTEMLEYTLCTCSCVFFCFFLGANIWSYSSVYSRSHLLGFLRRFFSDRTAKRGGTSSVLNKKLERNPMFSYNHLCILKGTEIGNSQETPWFKLQEGKNDLLWFILCKHWEEGRPLLLYPHIQTAHLILRKFNWN